MRGFWILWNGGPIDKARPDLESALASTVDPRYTDTMVMSALTNITSDEFKAASVEFANKIRRADRNIDDDAKGTLIWYYEISLHSAETLKAISEAVPAGEQVLVLDWLRQAEVREPEKRVATYYMAYFLERDGRADEALPIYKELMRPQPDGDDYVARFARANALGIENGRGKR